MACLTWRYWNSIISHTSRRVWGWTFLGWSDNQPLVAALGLLLAAASLGFLGHNWPLARIFMGDVGSAFLGYTFAVLPVVAAQHNPRLAVAGVLLVWPFLFRLRHRENIFAAHRSHLYQRLVIAGYSHRTVTLLDPGPALDARWSGERSGRRFEPTSPRSSSLLLTLSPVRRAAAACVWRLVDV